MGDGDKVALVQMYIIGMVVGAVLALIAITPIGR